MVPTWPTKVFVASYLGVVQPELASQRQSREDCTADAESLANGHRMLSLIWLSESGTRSVASKNTTVVHDIYRRCSSIQEAHEQLNRSPRTRA